MVSSFGVEHRETLADAFILEKKRNCMDSNATTLRIKSL
jgi:hypothetical protein